ncbi:cytochrome b [Yersinia ruckeri]|uniref:cytochrome b n=1 Tax=Yersinia ruckeri TaxID=29486 RepID=UPI000538CA02|nr:cytochrome b [Yersinia ruckeri]AUQ42427.1 cytochrome b [Yersinia ruckeri]MCK8585485.1 cytochrome b [Yersinia ruckeri]MCW6624944.1 cytochrome b [Yersinia ruckeri]WMS04129.1 cytochrome b [Yersinia ruckeri]
MRNRYTLSQITLHWLTLLMVILTYSAILLSDAVPDEYRTLVKNLHFNFGLSVWGLMLVRLWLRQRNPTPAITPPLPQWQAMGAHTLHWVIYLMFLSLPVLGVLAQAYGGKTWYFLGWQVPQWVTPNVQARSLIKQTHELIATLGYFVIGAHAFAALFHHYIRSDDTLRRMMPGK